MKLAVQNGRRVRNMVEIELTKNRRVVATILLFMWSIFGVFFLYATYFIYFPVCSWIHKTFPTLKQKNSTIHLATLLTIPECRTWWIQTHCMCDKREAPWNLHQLWKNLVFSFEHRTVLHRWNHRCKRLVARMSESWKGRGKEQSFDLIKR